MRWRLELLERPDLDATAKAVGLTLDTFMRNGRCWPSRAALAHRSGLSTRTVTRAIKRLELAGVLEIDRGAGRTTSRYRQVLHKDRGEPSPGVTQSHRRGDTESPQRCQRVPRKSLLNSEGKSLVEAYDYEPVDNKPEGLTSELARLLTTAVRAP